MDNFSTSGISRPLDGQALVTLLKPITWFPPMWAFLCGAISSNVPLWDNMGLVIAGAILAGPLVCGASQVTNDWFDREVDAINEPDRPIPSGRVPGNTALYFAVLWSFLSLAVGALLGPWVLAATVLGVLLAWAYSAPPLRLKLNGWWGNAAVGFSYEGLAWVTGAAALLQGVLPAPEIVLIAVLYSIGAHGIMTLNDFKSVDGDRQVGIRSIPARYGVKNATRIACVMMLIPQFVVIGLLVYWQQMIGAGLVGLLVIAQLLAMKKLAGSPKDLAPWYNATGVSLYVVGMMIAAFALRGVS